MDDPQAVAAPRTEAGRALLDDDACWDKPVLTDYILAIEAEARIQGYEAGCEASAVSDSAIEAEAAAPSEPLRAALERLAEATEALLDPSLSGLTERSQDYESSVRGRAHATVAGARAALQASPPTVEPLRAALDWALDNLDAEDEVIGDAMSWAITVRGQTTTMARSTEYESGKQKARAALQASASEATPQPAAEGTDAVEC